MYENDQQIDVVHRCALTLLSHILYAKQCLIVSPILRVYENDQPIDVVHRCALTLLS